MKYEVINGGDASQAITSTGFNTSTLPRRGTHLGVQVVCANRTAGDAVVTIEHSNDNVNFDPIAGATLTIDADNKVLTPIVDCAMTYYRAVYSPGTNTGTVTVIFSFN